MGHDVDFSHEAMTQAVNVDLANNIGNLFSRFITLARKRLGAQWQCNELPEPDAAGLRETITECAKAIQAGMEAGNPAIAARALTDSAAALNAFFQQQAPWQIRDATRLRAILGEIYHGLCDLTVMGLPFLPDAMARARRALGLVERASWLDIGRRRVVAHAREMTPLFPRCPPVDLSDKQP